MAKKSKHNLIDEINEVAEEIDGILNKKQKERYFEGIVVLYSFLEDTLKWLVFIQILWNKSEKEKISHGEYKNLKDYCNQSNFFSLLNLGLFVDLLDYDLHKKLNDVRRERNQLIHQYWLYAYKGKRAILRKKLEKLARISSKLVEKLNELVEDTGIDESYGLFDIRLGRHLIP